MKKSCKFDTDTQYHRLMKVFETCQTRIKTAEVFTKDKYVESTNYIKMVDLRVGSMAPEKDIEKVYVAQKNLKANFVNEFASFQQYLKD